MRQVRKNIIFGLFVFFLVSLYFSPQAHALSNYNIYTTSSLELRGTVNGDCGPEEEWGNRWPEFMSADTTNPNSYKNTWNYTSNYNYAQWSMDEFHTRFLSNLEMGSGWAIQHHTMANGTGQGVTIWLFNPDANLVVQNGQITASAGFVWYETFTYNPGAGCRWQAVNYNADQWSGSIHTVNIDNPLFLVASDDIIYPTDYSGPSIPTTADYADFDGDGLNSLQEVAQNTSNGNPDTDGDGLSDFTESELNPDRDFLFCGTSCSYPHPADKDLYVEVNWMKNPLTNESYKPSTAQLTSVVDSYSTHGIYAHFDTGEYGGGQELSQYTSELKFAPDTNDVDFFNIKNGTGDGATAASFSSSRHGIWHYMITSNKIALYDDSIGAYTNTYTGASYAGDDDVLVAIGRVKELAPTNQDQAIAGTIMHELGHNLCLSDTTYIGQDSSCIFSGIDHYAGSDYTSVMNYDKQLNMVDYSMGSNGTNDHNDWLAVAIGMDDFVTLGGDPVEASARSRTTFNKQVEK